MRQDEVNVYDLGDGLYVDQDGEIIGGEPDGALARICAHVADWQQQVEAYESAIKAGKAAIIRHQQEKKAVHGAWVANVRQNTYKDFDGESFRRDIETRITEGQVSARLLPDLVLAAREFDLSRIPVEIRPLLSKYISERQSKKFAILTPVLRDAPRPLYMPKEREVAS